MEKIKLKLEARKAEKPNQLRRSGIIPGTLYGPGIASTSVQVDGKEFLRLPIAAHSHMIELHGLQEGAINAIIRDVQRKHTTREVLNIEFYRVAADRKLTVTVPLTFIGTSPAIQLGGQMLVSHEEVEVECFPQDIPDNIEVDLSTITELDTGIHFKDLATSGKFEILNPPDEIVVRVVPLREEEAPKAEAVTEEAAAAAAPAAAPAATAAGSATSGAEKKK